MSRRRQYRKRDFSEGEEDEKEKKESPEKDEVRSEIVLPLYVLASNS